MIGGVTRGSHATAPVRRRVRPLTAAGLVLVAGGLGVLAYVAWQLWGTNLASERRHADTVAALERAWDGGDETVARDEGEADAVVRIPRFGDDYAVPVLEGVEDDALEAGFGHFTTSAAPGEVGNYALAGHRVTHGEPLRAMPDLEVGDTVVVETRSTTFTYELVTAGDALEVDFEDTWVVDPAPVNPRAGGVQPPQGEGERLLTLTTCASLFHTDERLVAFGVLTGSEPRT